MGVFFEEGEMGEMAADDDDDRSVFEVVVVVVSVLPSPSLLLASLLVVLLDCIGTTEGLTCSDPLAFWLLLLDISYRSSLNTPKLGHSCPPRDLGILRY